ncbi:hypothetical protein G9A89_016712 [Geosiphon pyriformis]|nr:hypothetical protein G9A89_016712 [Geosiphon pyriformis]
MFLYIVEYVFNITCCGQEKLQKYFTSFSITQFFYLVGSSTGGSNTGKAGVGTRSSARKNRFSSTYIYGSADKKAKKLALEAGVVDSSAGPLAMDVLDSGVLGVPKSWESKVNSEASSVGVASNIDNLDNSIVEETRYVDLDELNDAKAMDETTP